MYPLATATEDVEIDNIWRVFKTRTLLPLDTQKSCVQETAQI